MPGGRGRTGAASRSPRRRSLQGPAARAADARGLGTDRPAQTGGGSGASTKLGGLGKTADWWDSVRKSNTQVFSVLEAQRNKRERRRQSSCFLIATWKKLLAISEGNQWIQRRSHVPSEIN